MLDIDIRAAEVRVISICNTPIVFGFYGTGLNYNLKMCVFVFFHVYEIVNDVLVAQVLESQMLGILKIAYSLIPKFLHPVSLKM